MRNFLVLIGVFSLLTSSVNLMAKERRGAELVITKSDGQQIRGELIAVRGASLLLMESQSGSDVAVDLNDIHVIEVIKKSKTFSGAGIGFLEGVAGGALCGFLTGEIMRQNIAPKDTNARWRGAAAGGAIGGIIGALVGGIIGNAAGRPESFQIAGESQEKIKIILEKLRSHARRANLR